MSDLSQRMEVGNEVDTSWREQWAWKKFIENALLFLMLFGMVSFMVTYVIAIAVFHLPVQTAQMLTIAHAFIAFVLFFIDLVRQITTTASRSHIRGMWFDSSVDYAFGDIEMEKCEPLDIQKLFGGNDIKLKNVQNKEVNVVDYNNYITQFNNVQNSLRIIMVPKPYTIESALKADVHKEAVCGRYPITTKLPYAVFTLMLSVPYEDATLPIYELTYASGMVDERQKNLTWFLPNQNGIIGAVKAFDVRYGTKWRMLATQSQAFNKTLLDIIEEQKNYAEVVIHQRQEIYERTLGKGIGTKGTTDWFKKHFWQIMAVMFIVIIVCVSVYAITSNNQNNNNQYNNPYSSPTPFPTPTLYPTFTPSPTIDITPITPTPTPYSTPPIDGTPTPTPSPSVTPDLTFTPTPTPTATPTPTPSP